MWSRTQTKTEPDIKPNTEPDTDAEPNTDTECDIGLGASLDLDSDTNLDSEAEGILKDITYYTSKGPAKPNYGDYTKFLLKRV